MGLARKIQPVSGLHDGADRIPEGCPKRRGIGGGTIENPEYCRSKKKIKIGSKVMITTQKACAKDSFGAVKTGIPRQAVVIGIYEYFVHVQLESGVCESVMWMDLINARE